MILEHRAMQRQGRKLLTKNGPLSAGTAHYGWPWPINVVLVSGRIADEALSAAEGENAVGRPEGQEVVSNVANAQIPLIRCQLCERVISDPLLQFPVSSGTGGERHPQTFRRSPKHHLKVWVISRNPRTKA